MKSALAALAAPVLGVALLGGAAEEGTSSSTATQTLDVGALPAASLPWLPEAEDERLRSCPQMPLAWLVAQVEVESSWEPRALSSAGAAGLLQLMPGTWAGASATAAWEPGARPAPDHPVWDPGEHLAAALPWMCANLQQMAEHLAGSGKKTSVLDALAVCHVASCSRVTGSATGVPEPGEAGGSASCARTVRAYLDGFHTRMASYLTPVPAAAGTASTAAAWTGARGGCSVPDPTGTGGCVTPTTAWMLAQVQQAFPGLSVSCWDAHAWNPKSDQPVGRGCDYR